MAVPKVQITHNGTNGSKTVGTLYLADVGRRYSLGGSVGIYEYGQDRYLDVGATIQLVATSQVLMSVDRGMLKAFSSGVYAGISDEKVVDPNQPLEIYPFILAYIKISK